MTTSPAEQLAARLLYLQQQKKTIESEEREVKNALEELYGTDAISAKADIDMLFSDGVFHKVRLARVKTGTYFKVVDDHKDAYSDESHKLQAKYLKAGKAEMAEKAPSWRVQEVKG
jgi:copper chaperone CopZ